MSIHVRTSHVVVIVIAALALLVGTTTVGAVAGAKWIDGKRIEKNSIPANRLKTGSVGGRQLKNKAITKAQLAPLRAVRMLTGSEDQQ